MNLYESIRNNFDKLNEAKDSQVTNYIVNRGDYTLTVTQNLVGGNAVLKDKSGKVVGKLKFTEKDEPFYSDTVVDTNDLTHLISKLKPNIGIYSLYREGYEDEDLLDPDSNSDTELWVNGKIYWQGSAKDVDVNLLMDVADQASEEDGKIYDTDEVEIVYTGEGGEPDATLPWARY
ncbi:MAG: hypothetical protein J6T15_04680 [Bacilli bacterium]|nr:hypothetical protein [Bacilli bacterium]